MPVEWRPGEQGTGSLLMTGDGLTRRPDGRPHQAVFFFDENSRPTRLATNAAGTPLGYDQDQPLDDLDLLIELPDDVAAAARRWLADELAARSMTADDEV